MTNDSEAPLLGTRSAESLQRHLLVDLAAAATAAASISPIITAADRAVVENVSTGRPLIRTLTKHLLCPFTNPRRFFATRPVFVVWTLYAVTYFTANISETLIERYLHPDRKALTGTLISSAVFVVNTPLSVWKDVRFAQFFGNRVTAAASQVPRSGGSPVTTAAASRALVPRGMPKSVSAAFLARDVITVFGTFAIAPQVAALIPDTWAHTAQAKADVAQLMVPAATQVVATPAHLLGLDLYNRPETNGLVDRIGGAKRKLFSTMTMRAARLIPAWGVGIILNNHLRATYREGEGGEVT
ncbi:uncharacterized protein GGS22DRAFT_189353 [Annulohypoxylon maeteangense]|uniref:uncharacterized protein n=1 Tax=Annulohypoxylon maeteangense TaxID=1927788 RepID=UPI002008B567|nr:uncharacterized protein GGS22DRAFT_189353 [Annulohypoxylon maeteangense]KAI0884222.1 hypothetical protein GGS22DRAFT_189353 [Annulohypoxylon maeteangense]